MTNKNDVVSEKKVIIGKICKCNEVDVVCHLLYQVTTRNVAPASLCKKKIFISFATHQRAAASLSTDSSLHTAAGCTATVTMSPIGYDDVHCHRETNRKLRFMLWEAYQHVTVHLINVRPVY